MTGGRGYTRPMPATDVLSQVYATLQERKRADPASSYVARLYRDGLDAILKNLSKRADHKPEDSFYLWGPDVPREFTINYEGGES